PRAASVHAVAISRPQSVRSWKIAAVRGRSPAGIERSRSIVTGLTSGDFQYGENRYRRPCWWIRCSANATPRYGILFFSATDAAAAWRSEPKPPRWATTFSEASVSSRDTVLVASDSSSRIRSSSGSFLPATGHAAGGVHGLNGQLVSRAHLGA